MVTVSAAMEAEANAQERRFTLRTLLQVEESRAKPEDAPLIERIRAAATAKAYDELLAMPAIIDLFRRQVLFFGDVR